MNPTDLAGISMEISQSFEPLMVIGMAFVVLMFAKELLTEIARGLRFRFDPTFNEGDVVFLDSERAIIVKLGMITTVFGVTKEDGTYCWRYVPNTRIQSLKLEKIINLDNMKLPNRE